MIQYNTFCKLGIIFLVLCSGFSFAAIQDGNELAKLLVEKGYITEQKDYKLQETVTLFEVLQIATSINKIVVTDKYVCKGLVKGKKYPKGKKNKNCGIIENAIGKGWIKKGTTEKELQSTLDQYHTMILLLKASEYPILPDEFGSYVRYGFPQNEADMIHSLMEYGLLRHFEYDLEYYYLNKTGSWPANREFLFWHALTFESGILFQSEILDDFVTTRYTVTFRDKKQFTYKSDKSGFGKPEVVGFGRDKMYYRYYGSTAPTGNSSDYMEGFFGSIIEVDLKKKMTQESLTDYSETFISLDRVLYVYKNIMYVIEGDKKTPYKLNRGDKSFTLWGYNFSPDNTKIAFIVGGNVADKTRDTPIILDRKTGSLKRFEIQFTEESVCFRPKWLDNQTPDMFACPKYVSA